MASSSRNLSSSKNKGKVDDIAPLTVSTIIPKSLIKTKDFKEKFPTVNSRTWVVGMYPSSIRPSSIPVVKENRHCLDLNIIARDLSESIILPKKGFTYFYMYPFTLGPFSLNWELNSVITELCIRYQVYLAQVSPSVWRTIACLRRLCQETGEELTLA